MINRSQRMILMKKLSNYYQTENVSPKKKKELSASLLDNNDIRLHKLIMELEPVTDIGKMMLNEIYKAIQIG